MLDEPTTGLHFHDIEQLLTVLHRLRDDGNTIVVIEHNLDVIKTADWVVDLGPEGGHRGGAIIAAGTPEDIAAHPTSHTGRFLAPHLHARAWPPTTSEPRKARPRHGEPGSPCAGALTNGHATPHPHAAAVPHRTAVRWRDLDAFNHVNNAMYLRYLEEARLRWLMTLDGPWMDESVAPVVASALVNFKRPIAWPEDVTVELFVDRSATAASPSATASGPRRTHPCCTAMATS